MQLDREAPRPGPLRLDYLHDQALCAPKGAGDRRFTHKMRTEALVRYECLWAERTRCMPSLPPSVAGYSARLPTAMIVPPALRTAGFLAPRQQGTACAGPRVCLLPPSL